MIKLDKTKVYDLKGLNEEQLQQVVKQCEQDGCSYGLSNLKTKDLKEGWNVIRFNTYNNEWWIEKQSNIDGVTTNAIELFYTLENVQVDCKGLHETQIDNMASIFKAHGYKIWEDKKALKVEVINNYTHIYYSDSSKLFLIDRKQKNKYEVTYEKFIELFSNKEFKELNLHNIAVNVLDCDKEQLEIAISIFKKNNLNHAIIRMPYTRRKGFLISAVKDLGKINYVEISYDKFIELFGDVYQQAQQRFGHTNIKIDIQDDRKMSDEDILNISVSGCKESKEKISNAGKVLVEELKQNRRILDIETGKAKAFILEGFVDEPRKSYGETEHSKRVPTFQENFNPQPHYDNTNGSLYKIGTERKWNPYLFDVVKRLERGGKKDPLKQEIEKSIDVLKIWLNELQ